MPRIGATLIQICWLLLEGIDTRSTDVTNVSHIAIPPTAAVFYGNKTAPSPRKSSTSSIPVPTKPRQHDAHVKAYRKHEAAKRETATMERITACTVLRAGLKVWAPRPSTTIGRIPQRVREVPNKETTSYIVKLPGKITGTPVSTATQIKAAKPLNTTRARGPTTTPTPPHDERP